jgi:hypothetical protein
LDPTSSEDFASSKRRGYAAAFGHVDRSKMSAIMREILDAMWLFNGVFVRALAKFNEIKAR